MRRKQSRDPAFCTRPRVRSLTPISLASTINPLYGRYPSCIRSPSFVMPLANHTITVSAWALSELRKVPSLPEYTSHQPLPLPRRMVTIGSMIIPTYSTMMLISCYFMSINSVMVRATRLVSFRISVMFTGPCLRFPSMLLGRFRVVASLIPVLMRSIWETVVVALRIIPSRELVV